MPTKHRSKKDKRHSGRITPKIIKPKMKYDDMKIEVCTPEEVYDDWIEKRDGMRDTIYLEWKKKDKKKRRKRKA